MSRIAYVNGRYLPHRKATVHVEDRGYQFADGVYEVCEVAHGYLVDMQGHLDRLTRSLSELSINWPVSRSALETILKETVRRNRVRNGLVYLQITRGVARRDFHFPSADVKPSLVVTSRSASRSAGEALMSRGVAVITVPESRWPRVDIKSVSLLPNVLAKQKARENGAVEAWFVDPEGLVKEGSSSNAWIVSDDGILKTRPADYGILRGITRGTVMKVADAQNVKVKEMAFSVDEALNAREAFYTSATSLVMPVISIDGKVIGEGRPGPVAKALRKAFYDTAQKTAL